eukprot:TRINITY_DN15211_c0_g1_i1.p1 TRINITY_DN15211_c0_g1~~TRINITY_DN15211_c0_g1_i1.p1  ORF type:complete len:466 (+),score=97.54 TRINITY_DN15211_c0_g1_i1:1-1398(+)
MMTENQVELMENLIDGQEAEASGGSDMPQEKSKCAGCISFGEFFKKTPLPLLLLVFITYFSQGTESFLLLSISYFSLEILNLTPTQTQIIQGSITWPWLPKFLYGFLTDSIPILRYRRKPYVLMVCGISTIGYISIACFGQDAVTFSFLLLFAQFGFAFNDVVIDGLVVQSSQEGDDANYFQTVCAVASSMGIIVTSSAGGFLIESVGPQNSFVILSIIPVLIMFVTLFVREEPSDLKLECKTFKEQMKKLFSVLKEPVLWKPVLFIFLSFATPNVDSGNFFFITQELGISPIFLGFMSAATGVAGLLGVIAFNVFLKDASIKKVFVGILCFISFLGLFQLALVFRINTMIGIPDQVLLISTKTAGYIARTLYRLVIFVFATKLCPKNIESTMFATLMGIFNLGALISDYSGALIMSWLNITQNNFDNLWIGIIIERTTQLLPLLFVQFLPDHLTTEDVQIVKDD